MYQETREEQKDGEEEEGKFWNVECNIIAQIRIINKVLAVVGGLRLPPNVCVHSSQGNKACVVGL